MTLLAESDNHQTPWSLICDPEQENPPGRSEPGVQGSISVGNISVKAATYTILQSTLSLLPTASLLPSHLTGETTTVTSGFVKSDLAYLREQLGEIFHRGQGVLSHRRRISLRVRPQSRYDRNLAISSSCLASLHQPHFQLGLRTGRHGSPGASSGPRGGSQSILLDFVFWPSTGFTCHFPRLRTEVVQGFA